MRPAATPFLPIRPRSHASRYVPLCPFSACRFSSFLSFGDPLSWSYASFSPICRPGFSQRSVIFLVGRDARAGHPATGRHSSDKTVVTQGDCLWDCHDLAGTAGRLGTPWGRAGGDPCHARISRPWESSARSTVTLRDEFCACGAPVRAAAVLIDMTQAPSRRQLI